MFSDNQSSGMVDSDSLPSLNKMEAAFGQYHGAETVDMEDDEDLKDSLIDNEWAELDAKGWIDLPFELQSADAVLSSVSAILADDVLDLQLGANAIIADLVRPDSDVGEHAQETLRTMKNSVQEMTSRVKGFNRAIDTLLDDYEDMALMNLSRLLTHPDRFVQPVPQAVLEEESDEPELILEAHLQRGHTLINALTLVEGQIHSTEEFAVRKSDTIRNRLLFINMVISIIFLAVSIANLVASLFGMNVPHPLVANPNGFPIVAWPSLAGVLVIVTAVPTALRRYGALPNVFKRS
jgi:magnesium transporter